MKRVFIERNKLFKNIPMILLNSIIEADESFIEDNFELFYSDCESCDGSGEKDNVKCDECCGEGRHNFEPYQYFIVSVNEFDIERLKEYGVEVGYSNKLDAHIIPIYDYGTSWNAFSYSKEVDDEYELLPDETLDRKTVY